MNLAEIFSGPLTPAKWRALGEHLTGGIVRGGPGVRIRQVGNQVLVSAKRRFGGGGGGSFSHPFKLTTSVVEDEAKYTIGKGSITDGTNGAAIDLTGVIETEMTASAGHVVIEGTVDEDLDITGWAAVVVTEADAAKEVGLTTTGTIRQDKIRLHIGELTMAGTPAVATAWAALTSSVRISHSIINGVECKVFEHSSTHSTKV